MLLNRLLLVWSTVQVLQDCCTVQRINTLTCCQLNFTSYMHTFQAVLLVGGASSDLFPLTAAGTPKVLLPVANETLLSFSLKTLEEAAIQNVIAVRRALCIWTRAVM